MITILIAFLISQAEPIDRVKCSSGNGPINIDPTGKTTVWMKCCPRDFYIADPEHPADKNGNLICVRET